MEQTMDRMDTVHLPVIELMGAHRSIRSYTPNPVPDEWIERIVQAAQWSSSTCFRQMYTVIAIRDPQTKGELMRLCGNQTWIEHCPVFLAFCADMSRLDEICQQHDTRVNLEYVETLLAAVLDVGLFMQNAALAAESLGLGIVMIGGVRDHPREMIQLLQLPKGVFCVSGMCLGFPLEHPSQSPRLPLDEVLYWERYRPEGRSERLAAYDEAIREALVYRPRKGVRQSWTDVMARTTSKPPPDEGRQQIAEILREQGFALK